MHSWHTELIRYSRPLVMMECASLPRSLEPGWAPHRTGLVLGLVRMCCMTWMWVQGLGHDRSDRV